MAVDNGGGLWYVAYTMEAEKVDYTGAEGFEKPLLRDDMLGLT